MSSINAILFDAEDAAEKKGLRLGSKSKQDPCSKQLVSLFNW